MSEPHRPLRYPAPLADLFPLVKHIKNHTRIDADLFTARIARHIQPPPLVAGALPANPRFILAANHYERPGLWILHVAAVLSRLVADRYGPANPPMRWMVTANWPPVNIGPWSFPSPGDWLLPRVAHALHCYPVSFAGVNPPFTARTLRRVLADAPAFDRPLGIFPEGVAGKAGAPLQPALPGVGRLMVKLRMSVVPAGISEDGRFVVNFGSPISAAELAGAPDPGALVMDRIRQTLCSREAS